MIRFVVYARDTRIYDTDYIFEDCEKLLKLLPYLKKKIEGTWNIAVLLPSIKYARKFVDEEIVPEYVDLVMYLEKDVSTQLMSERPKLLVKEKTAYERYMDIIADMKVLIDPKAAKELYFRVGQSKGKLQEYLMELADQSNGQTVTLDMVKRNVVDERRLYASDVLNAFLLRDRWRWKRYEKFVSALGRDYAFYSLRKYVTRLVREKNKYLRNEETTIRGIERIDGFSINHAFIVFNTTVSSELDMCMHMLDDRDLLRRII